MTTNRSAWSAKSLAFDRAVETAIALRPPGRRHGGDRGIRPRLRRIVHWRRGRKTPWMKRPGLSAFVDPLRRARHTAEGVEKALLAAADLSAGAISVPHPQRVRPGARPRRNWRASKVILPAAVKTSTAWPRSSAPSSVAPPIWAGRPTATPARMSRSPFSIRAAIA